MTTPEERARLARLATAAQSDADWFEPPLFSGMRQAIEGVSDAEARFIAACSPAVVLSLLQDAERAQEERSALRKAVTELYRRRCCDSWAAAEVERILWPDNDYPDSPGCPCRRRTTPTTGGTTDGE